MCVGKLWTVCGTKKGKNPTNKDEKSFPHFLKTLFTFIPHVKFPKNTDKQTALGDIHIFHSPYYYYYFHMYSYLSIS